MAPDYGAHVSVAVYRGQEFFRILEPDLVQPAAGHGNRVMVQAHHRVLRARAGQGAVELAKHGGTHAPTGRTGNAAVEKNDAPGADVDMASEDEGLVAELAPHCRRVVVVSGKAQHRDAEISKQASEIGVPGRIVLDDIAGDQHRIHRPVTHSGARKRALERGQRLHAAQGLCRAPVQVRVGELEKAQDAHRGQMLAKGAPALSELGQAHARPDVMWPRKIDAVAPLMDNSQLTACGRDERVHRRELRTECGATGAGKT